MLIRHTILYLPAQFLPALAQFLSLIAWSHFASAAVIGMVTLFVSIQEFLVLAFMGFWTNYTVRYASKADMPPEEAERLRRTATAFVLGSSALQGLIAIVLYLVLIDPHPRLILLPILALVVGVRAINTYQSERARGRGDILLYSMQAITGPVVGLVVGIGLLIAFGSDELWIFLGYASAQSVAAVLGLLRDRSWVVFGRLDLAVLRHAMRYGIPLIASSTFIWVTQNTPRILVSHFDGLAAAGVYALGFGLGFRVSMVAAMSVTAAAFPLAVRYANAGDQPRALRQLSQNATLLFAVLAPMAAGLAIVSRDVLELFVAEPLRAGSYPVMLWALLAGSVICLRQHVLHQVFLLDGDTWPIGVVSAAEAAAAVLLGLAIVPWFGAVGGIVSLTVTSFGSMTVMLILAMRKGFQPPWPAMLRIGAATLAMVVAVALTPAAQDVAGLALRIGVGGVVFVTGAALGHVAELKALLGQRRVRAAG